MRPLTTQVRAPVVAQVSQSGSPLGCAQLIAEPGGRQAQHPVQLIAARELLAQALLLRPLERLHRQLVAARQLQHHITEALALQFHQELDRITAGTTGKAVIKLLGRRYRHRR